MKRKVVLIAAALYATAALASWYDDYDAGLAAARSGQWQVVVQKMTAAINANGKEGDKTRTYSTIFINYHPYYYRGVAYLNTGKYQQAIADFEKTSGPGADDYGSLDVLMQKAKAALAQPEPKQPEVKQPELKPPVPSFDPALKVRARTALDAARGEIDKARQRNAVNSPDFQKAMNDYIASNSRFASANSNDDFNAIIAEADNISLLAQSAVAPPVPLPPVNRTDTGAPVPPSRPDRAANDTLAATQGRLRRALESYFNGDFGEAAQRFESLSRELPRNGWIWAFLGASQYSQYAFEGQDSYKASALDAFRKAKQFGRKELPEKYFSRKIRKAFRENAG